MWNFGDFLKLSALPLRTLRLCGGIRVFPVPSWMVFCPGSRAVQDQRNDKNNTKTTAETQRTQRKRREDSLLVASSAALWLRVGNDFT
jgi:hypothetical protein